MKEPILDTNDCDFNDTLNREHSDSIAVIGMAGIFPGADSLQEFWHMLQEGRAGLIPAFEEYGSRGKKVIPVNRAYKDKAEFVSKVYGLPNKARFDAEFFGISPREAEMMDPQHRLFLETAWTALEHACIIPDETTYPVGVYGACGFNAYLFNNMPGILNPASSMGQYLEVLVGNDKEYLATRTSYKLNLTGPSMVVQTACSSSLTAVILACQALADYQCDVALAGGSSIQMGQDGGYLPEEDAPLSSTGEVRAFDAEADGVAGGSGCAIVVLKRLDDAVQDGDVIYSIIQGYGLNNDGADKVNFTAPSVNGQVRVVAEALANADICPSQVGYVECHGTGTPLGDPIEISALAKAFEIQDQELKIPIGSVKTMVGHLDTAAGVAALIKATLALYNEEIPPSLNFAAPNPEIDFSATPFEVCNTNRSWPRTKEPRYAAVSSFGFGGTNTHLILEEGPPIPAQTNTFSNSLILPISARDEDALNRAATCLASFLPKVDLSASISVLQRHRKRFNKRAAVVVSSTSSAISALKDYPSLIRGITRSGSPRVVFMFPGQGCQYPDMARDLYEAGGTFTQVLDRLFDTAIKISGKNLRPILLPPIDKWKQSSTSINQVENSIVAVFMIELALAKQFIAWGIKPDAMLGYSLGEYAAACVAGVMSEEDALAIVLQYGVLAASLKFNGAVLSVSLSQESLTEWLTNELDIVAVDGPELTVLSGTQSAINTLSKTLQDRRIKSRMLNNMSGVFHCGEMDVILDKFRTVLSSVKLSVPETPLLSGTSGDYAVPEAVVQPNYWTDQLRKSVMFSDNLIAATAHASTDDTILLELGPGNVLSTLARQHPVLKEREIKIVSTIPTDHDHKAGNKSLPVILGSVAKLWTIGVEPDWDSLHGAPSGKIGLPGYSFGGRRYWRQPDIFSYSPDDGAPEHESVDDWFMEPVWTRSPYLGKLTHPTAQGCWLIFSSNTVKLITDDLKMLLTQSGATVVQAIKGTSFEKLTGNRYSIRPGSDTDLADLLADLFTRSILPENVVFLWGLDHQSDVSNDFPLHPERIELLKTNVFDTQVSLVRHLAANNAENVHVTIFTSSQFDVAGDRPDPLMHMIQAPLLTTLWEHPNYTGSIIDLGRDIPTANVFLIESLSKNNNASMHHSSGQIRAIRNEVRWVRDYVPTPLKSADVTVPKICGPVLIIGGLGGIGLAYTKLLAHQNASPLVIASRTPFPAEEVWAQQPDGSIARILLKLREETGVKILTVVMDCADKKMLEDMVNDIETQYGSFSGVIHAAGVPGGGMIVSKLPEGTDSNFHAKISVLAAIDTVFKTKPLTFMQLCSSISSIQGALGQVDNCASNLVFDGFASWAQTNRPWPVTSINWARWQSVGMAQDVEKRHSAISGHELLTGMSEDDALDVACRLLGCPAPQVLVGNRNPFDLVRTMLATANVPVNDLSDFKTTTEDNLDRPKNYGTPYVAPRDDVESILAKLWSLSLGIKHIGINDDFMQLGGDSLIAIALMDKIRKTFRAQIPLSVLFEVQTITGLATWLRENEAEPGLTDKIAVVVRSIRGTPEM